MWGESPAGSGQGPQHSGPVGPDQSWAVRAVPPWQEPREGAQESPWATPGVEHRDVLFFSEK